MSVTFKSALAVVSGELQLIEQSQNIENALQLLIKILAEVLCNQTMINIEI